MQPDIPPEIMKILKRRIWLHAALSAVILVFLGYVTWRLFTAGPLQLMVLAAVLLIVRELAHGARILHEHWVDIWAEARAAGLKRWWWLD